MKASASRADNQGVLVSMYMTRSPVCVAPDEDLAGVARVMAERSIRAVPVVEDDKLVGLLSRSDLLHALPADVHPFSVEFQAGKQVGVRVAQAMSRDVVTVRPDEPVDVAVAIVVAHRICNAKPVAKASQIHAFASLLPLLSPRMRAPKPNA